MSLYNLINGVGPAAYFILPFLGKLPDEYPRFRDCFTHDPEHPEYDDKIHIYTRVGGGNRESYEAEINELRAMAGYLADHDDNFDSTYATFVYEIPEKWKRDYEFAKQMKLADVSPEYRELICNVFPKLSERFSLLFSAAAVAKKESKAV